MRLPEAIERAIESEADGVPGKALAKAAEALSARYRERGGTRDTQASQSSRAATCTLPLTEIERLAYAIVRAPATYAAAAAVFEELAQRAPDLRIESLLDLGCGPGAATWAALAERHDIARVTLIEQDRGFSDLGRRIVHALARVGPGSQSRWPAESEWEWLCADLRALPQLAAHDLVIMSYALAELRGPDRDRARQREGSTARRHREATDETALRVVERAWAATRRVLIVIEPGTPFHFDGILAVRDHLIRDGAFIAAPCPHASACPMADVDDWCHMPARVERTSLHRRLKAAALPYEDEKFSYVIATREPVRRTTARIIRRPEIQKGFVGLTLCTAGGVQREGVTRSDRDAFRRARKADWGDAF